MVVSDLRTQSREELESALQDKQESLFNLKFRHILGQLEDTSQIKRARRDLAQLKTILRARELGIESPR